MIKKQSFLSNMLGEETYDKWKGYARIIVAVGILVLLIIYGLSYFFHSSVVSYLLKLTTGMSLLFIAYIVMWVLLLDIRVNVDEPERMSWEKPKEVSKPLTYKLSAIWTIILILLGLSAIYFSNKYRKHYAFECDTFLVDNQAHLYHLDWTECEASENAENLEELQGFQVSDGFTLCEECKEIADEAEADYESERLFRR